MRKNKYTSGRWKDAFAFSRRERRGIAVLLTILLCECTVLWWMHHRPVTDTSPPDGLEEFIQAADAFYAEQEEKEKEKERETKKEKSPARTYSLFPFDPNTLDSAGWQRLGLEKNIIRRILKYREKGGRFRKPEDLQKIYGLSQQQYARLSPSIVLPAETERPRQQPVTAKVFVPVDIGFADTLELLRIRGVGPAFARRIHSYRDRLGGFTSTSQLREVYGMNDSLLEVILPQVTLSDTANVRKIDINHAGVDNLRRHPYIGREVARLIVNYRLQHGPYSSVEELQKIPLVTAELCRKLAPYLSME